MNAITKTEFTPKINQMMKQILSDFLNETKDLEHDDKILKIDSFLNEKLPSITVDALKCSAITHKKEQCKNKAKENGLCSRHSPNTVKTPRTKLSKNPCQHILIKGEKKGSACGKNTPEGETYCKAHSNEKKNKKVPEVSDISSDEKVLEKEQDEHDSNDKDSENELDM